MRGGRKRSHQPGRAPLVRFKETTPQKQVSEFQVKTRWGTALRLAIWELEAGGKISTDPVF